MIRLIFSLVSILSFTEVYGGTYFTVSGNLQSSSAGLSETKSQIASGTIAFDVGSFLRLGFTHRQKIEDAQGYKQLSDSEEYSLIRIKTHQISNSLDLTVILYQGELVFPYLKGGAIVKTETIEYETSDETIKSDPITFGPHPSVGAGIGIRVHQNFTLKISYTVSPGVKTDPETQEQKGTIDTYTELGLTYKI